MRNDDGLKQVKWKWVLRLNWVLFVFNELKGAKVVVFKEMNDSEVVTIYWQKNKDRFGEKISKDETQPDLVIKRMGGGKRKGLRNDPWEGLPFEQQSIDEEMCWEGSLQFLLKSNLLTLGANGTVVAITVRCWAICVCSVDVCLGGINWCVAADPVNGDFLWEESSCCC